MVFLASVASSDFYPSHLFDDPISEDLTLLRKILNVAFHVFTLGIPLCVYHLWKVCVPRISVQAESLPIPEWIKNILVKRKVPYPSEAEVALNYGREVLEANPQITPFRFSTDLYSYSKTHQPLNEEIGRLGALFWNDNYYLFVQQIKANNPWDNSILMDKADQLMKIAYTMAILMLDELNSFKEDLKAKGIKRSVADTFTRGDSYQIQAFFAFTYLYHIIRGGINVEACPKERFFAVGTVPFSWRLLYNDFCERLKVAIPVKSLRAMDNRFANWSVPDKDPYNFKAVPDFRLVT